MEYGGYVEYGDYMEYWGYVEYRGYVECGVYVEYGGYMEYRDYVEYRVYVALRSQEFLDHRCKLHSWMLHNTNLHFKSFHLSHRWPLPVLRHRRSSLIYKRVFIVFQSKVRQHSKNLR